MFFLMPDAYWQFIVNSLGHRREQRNKMLFQRNNKARADFVDMQVEHNPQEREDIPNRTIHTILISIIAMKGEFEELQTVT